MESRILDFELDICMLAGAAAIDDECLVATTYVARASSFQSAGSRRPMSSASCVVTVGYIIQTARPQTPVRRSNPNARMFGLHPSSILISWLSYRCRRHAAWCFTASAPVSEQIETQCPPRPRPESEHVYGVPCIPGRAAPLGCDRCRCMYGRRTRGGTLRYAATRGCGKVPVVSWKSGKGVIGPGQGWCICAPGERRQLQCAKIESTAAVGVASRFEVRDSGGCWHACRKVAECRLRFDGWSGFEGSSTSESVAFTPRGLDGRGDSDMKARLDEVKVQLKPGLKRTDGGRMGGTERIG